MIEKTFDLDRESCPGYETPEWLKAVKERLWLPTVEEELQLKYTLRDNGSFWAVDLFYKDNETGAKYMVWENHVLDLSDTVSMEEARSMFFDEFHQMGKEKRKKHEIQLA